MLFALILSGYALIIDIINEPHKSIHVTYMHLFFTRLTFTFSHKISFFYVLIDYPFSALMCYTGHVRYVDQQHRM